MQIVSVEKLNEGDILGKSLFNRRSELLLASGYELNREMIELIKARGFKFVYVMNEITKDIKPEEVISDTVRQIANQKLAKTFEGVRNNLAFEKFAPEDVKRRLEDHTKLPKMLAVPEVRRVVGQILEEIVENQITMFTSLPMKSDSGKDYEHAMDTSVLALLISREFRYDYADMRALGTSAMVHDVGKLVFPTLSEKRPQELTGAERTILREHPIYSKLILEGSEPDAFMEQTTVLQHHEQNNGKGYPQMLTGCGKPPYKGRGDDAGYIYRHAEILAVANVYDNLVSGSHDGVTYTPDQAITAIVNGRAGSWNYYVIRALLRVVQCFPVGTSVRVKNNASKSYIGYTGVIARANPDDQTKPVIVLTEDAHGQQIKPKQVDFKSESFMAIELVV